MRVSWWDVEQRAVLFYSNTWRVRGRHRRVLVVQEELWVRKVLQTEVKQMEQRVGLPPSSRFAFS